MDSTSFNFCLQGLITFYKGYVRITYSLSGCCRLEIVLYPRTCFSPGLGEIVWARCVLQHSILLVNCTTVQLYYGYGIARDLCSVSAEEFVSRRESCEELRGDVFGASSVKM